ncbi:DegT/DnrJ/EryC1/StrS family aminotransferase [Thermosulfurimonas sp. F29]|uniref:DegT/DnrJ/EryC1/StrS family aminotransferase n=1 Tax=Thermosulfurimonas sp. F29 TaxID=2867247 RepID=UPI001C83F5B5|nr:DegT/DnrJ/EryC1/StrS family aminotransferase [Thermosulfurimonas sp. F29]MBX6423460.1 DegT/DnrJ/EryC1/StrS family aminotransferase [Thermosulfurimonas sp. F29]
MDIAFRYGLRVVVRVLGGRRNALQDFLRKEGIDTAVYYPLSVHLQPALRRLGYRLGDFPVNETGCDEVTVFLLMFSG